MKDKEVKITPEMTGAAIMMAEEAKYRMRMSYKLAKALLTGKIDKNIVGWAEQEVYIYERLIKDSEK